MVCPVQDSFAGFKLLLGAAVFRDEKKSYP